ncbi:hypothetical protein L218DRAFT_885719, partial [Marasmius fiardii PR-910]
VFSATLLVYDVFINLRTEIEYIWMNKWSSMTVLYILQRYLPFFDITGVTLHHHFGASLSPRRCSLDHKMAAWSYTVGIMLSEIILTLRVWAVWERGVIVGVGLVVFFLTCWIPYCVFVAQFSSAMSFSPFPHLPGCFITDAGGSSILYLFYVLFMVYDTGIFLMMIIPGVAAYKRGGSSELVKTIYRDGKLLFESFSPLYLSDHGLGIVYYMTLFCELFYDHVQLTEVTKPIPFSDLDA